MSRAKIGALIVIVLLAVYLFAMAHRGVLLMLDPNWIAKAMGAGMIVIPLIGAWALVRELSFGASMERLGRRLGDEGGLPEDALPRSPGGRILREAADREFEKYRAETEASPHDWRCWFRLSCAYDAAGDRTRARKAMRRSIALEKAQQR